MADPPGVKHSDKDGKFVANGGHGEHSVSHAIPMSEKRHDIEPMNAFHEAGAPGTMSGSKPERMKVSPSALRATQNSVDSRWTPEHSKSSDIPTAIVHKGEFHIVDGHHRANHAVKTNTPLEMNVYNHNGKDPAFQKWSKKIYGDEEVAQDQELELAFDYAMPGSEAEVRLRGREGLAFDFKSARTYTPEGHLHVEQSNISKANVSPYRGKEIPRWQELGLDPEHVYQLLRDPKELEKAAATFNNKPLLDRHVAVTADDHDPDLVMGNVSNVSYDHPYLKGDLGIWRRDGIDGVESKEKQQLSSAYRYKADMTPGSYLGAPYDGVMRDIVGNHVALVKDGRAGDDVVVGDEDMAGDDETKHDPSNGRFTSGGGGEGGGSSKEKKEGESHQVKVVKVGSGGYEIQTSDGQAFRAKTATQREEIIAREKKRLGIKDEAAKDNSVVGDSKENMMTKKVLSRTAVAVQGALAVYLQPKFSKDEKVKLAMDAKPLDIAALLTSVSAKNFKKQIPTIVKGVEKATKGLLAQDADIEDLAELLDALKTGDVTEGSDLDPSSGLPKVEADTELDPDDVSKDDDPMAKVMQFLKGKIADEDLAQVAAMAQGGATDADETPEEKAAREKKEAQAAKDKDMPDDKVSKKEMQGAMDAALKKNTAETEDRVIKRMQGIAEAKSKVAPLVGELNMAFDSADGVFIHALKADKVDADDLDGLNTKALGLLVDSRIALKAASSKGRRSIEGDGALAMDSKDAITNFAKRYPGAAKIEVGA